MARRATPTEEPEESPKLSRAQVKQRQLRVLLFSILAAIVLVVAGVVLRQMYWVPFHKPVVTVDGVAIRMDYFLNRTRMAGNDPSATLQQLVYEQVVKLEAPKLGATVSDQEIDGALEQAALSAASNNGTQYDVATSEGYRAWYKNLLKSTGLSNAQYRDMIRVNIIAEKIKAAIGASIPATGEQVHLHVIVLGNSADAAKAKARLDNGEAFATVAKQMSLDTSTRDNGGDAGWVPKGLLPYDDTIFQLEIGKVSSPVLTNSSAPSTSQYLLFMVSEKDPQRAIDPSMKAQLEQTSFYYWLNQQMQTHKITYELTADDQAWVSWQLARTR